jgi:CRP-like cAMP-binding protein
MDADDLSTIRRSALFARVGEHHVVEVIGADEPRDLPRGTTLFSRGETIDRLPLLLSGWVRLFRAGEDGGEAVVSVIGAGRAIGETAALLGRPVEVGAATIAPSRVLMIDAARLRARLVADPDFAFAMLASAALHLRGMVGSLERLGALSGPRRLAGFLVDLLPAGDGPAVFDLPYEKSLIAAELGMTPESLSRAIARLGRHGVVVRRGRVEIARPSLLRAFLVGDRA